MTPVRKTHILASSALATIIMLAVGNPASAETTGGSDAAPSSAYGCKSLEEIAELQMIEGKDGMFFRILADLRLQHAFTDQTVDHLAAMAKALEKNGTTLIYVPLPTKSQVLPELVPARASLYGFEAGIATEIYDDVVRRLNEKGVAAVDIATPMRENNRNGFGEYSLGFVKGDVYVFVFQCAFVGPEADGAGHAFLSFPQSFSLEHVENGHGIDDKLLVRSLHGRRLHG